MAGIELIETKKLTGAASAVSFTSIPSTYQNLRVEFLVSLDTDTFGQLRMNGDTGSNYQWNWMRHQTSTFTVEADAAATYVKMIYQDGSTDYPVAGWLNIFDYADTGEWKTAMCEQESAKTSALSGGIWKSTAAINQIDFTTITGDFRVGTTFTLFGLSNS
jgi:hypothetical protein